MIQVVCTNCGLRILVPPTVQGRRGVCFNCGAPVEVPRADIAAQRAELRFQANDRISDRYVIEDQIGSGGMGVVYRARDALVNERVALKFMKPQLLRTAKGKELFIQEAQIARRLRHENIVAVHDVSWTSDGVLYLSMEYIEGQSLRAFLRKHRVDRRFVPIRLAVSLLGKILRALEYAHRAVVHRDIKPENVMLMPGEWVKVLDFGLAKAVQEEGLEAETSGDRPDRVIGTLAYAAPEQKQRRLVDSRADIYAVGLLFRELLTLRTPLDKPVQVGQARDDVSPSLMAVLDKALREEKEQRWQSAREFRLALDTAFEESYRRPAPGPANGGNGGGSTEGMAYLEGGSFLMGREDAANAAPEREVHVRPFWIDKFPVTVRDYAKFIEATAHAKPKFWRDGHLNGPEQPVVGVTWADACAYAAWAGKQLPTEAQWEFAARGKDNRRYPWGNLPPDSTLANFAEFLGMPSNVNMHEDGATPEGVHDLAGNVYEWTADPYASNAATMDDAPRRAARGGCWASSQDELDCAARAGFFAESQLPTLGFRCVIAEE